MDCHHASTTDSRGRSVWLYTLGPETWAGPSLLAVLTAAHEMTGCGHEYEPEDLSSVSNAKAARTYVHFERRDEVPPGIAGSAVEPVDPANPGDGHVTVPLLIVFEAAAKRLTEASPCEMLCSTEY